MIQIHWNNRDFDNFWYWIDYWIINKYEYCKDSRTLIFFKKSFFEKYLNFFNLFKKSLLLSIYKSGITFVSGSSDAGFLCITKKIEFFANG